MKKTTSKKTNSKKAANTINPQMPTLLQAIERVVELSRDSQLNEQFMLEAGSDIGFIADSFGITDRQAVFFCICMQKGPRCVDYDDLANHLDISKIRVLSYFSDIDALVRRRLLRYRDAKDEESFDIPNIVIKYLKHNEVYELPKRKNIDCAELFEIIEQWFEDLSNDAISPKDLALELSDLYKDNPQIGFVQQMKELYLSLEDTMLLTLFCHLLVNENDNDVRFNQIDDIYERAAAFNRVKITLRDGSHILMQKKLIEHRCEDGIADTTRYKLTNHAKRILLAEMKIVVEDDVIVNVLKSKDLTEKQMYYTDENNKQVDELAEFFDEKLFQQIRERMQSNGFRTGFACLFYGSPGTGKTETVYQLARKTGRDIMVVEVPQIKSKWVGDSEKNIKALFDKYREIVKRSERAPILLFNEADAIIGIRKNGAQSAVDKMENSIQNIILQEMETLDGIMIATTNLEQNLDMAFERRFLYKLKFEKPNAKVRQYIWKHMIPELTDDDAEILAKGYDFSGGQIENIARKLSINVILHGSSAMNLPNITSYCNNERLTNSDTKRIGFNTTG